MGVLEDITKMRKRGLTDNDIVKNLQDQGISPKAINDALNQADIKKAVSEENQSQEGEFLPSQSSQEGYGGAQEVSEQEEGADEAYYPRSESQGYGDYGVQQQQGYDYSQSPGGLDTGTIIEISEQVFLEKIQKIQNKIDEVSEFKTMAESKLDLLSERLKKIETTMDKLQLAILEKIGSYGSNLEGIRKEMSMMQDSFGKIAESSAGKAEKKAVPEPKEFKKSSQKKSGDDDENVFSNLRKISRKK